jgi:hypothetical protein
MLRMPLHRAITLAYGMTSFAWWQSLVHDQGLAPAAAEEETIVLLETALFRCEP